MPENILPLSFFESFDTITLAQKLLGCELVYDSPEGVTSGIIVETEAYLQNDPACHAFNRRTLRTEPMYGPPGTVYVYLIYGMYQCVNIVSNKAGIGEAVLIRALEPMQGIDIMQARRILARKGAKNLDKKFSIRELCKGPGKLVQAMGIDRSIHNNKLLSENSLFIREGEQADFQVGTSARVGLTVGTDLAYRFFIKNSPYVSK